MPDHSSVSCPCSNLWVVKAAPPLVTKVSPPAPTNGNTVLTVEGRQFAQGTTKVRQLPLCFFLVFLSDVHVCVCLRVLLERRFPR